MSRSGLSLTVALALVISLSGGCPTNQIPIPLSDQYDGVFLVSPAAWPTAVVGAPDGRVFYTEKNTGRVRVIVQGDVLADPLIDVPVNIAGERGLIGLAIHPDFENNGRLYLLYARSDTGADSLDPRAVVDLRVVYVDATTNTAAGETFVAALPIGSEIRLGGRLAFGADGKLYVALGDYGDPPSAADDNSLQGKILRYNDDGTAPDDNPTAGSPIYAKGLRQPTGLCFDVESETGYFADVQSAGQSELNTLTAGADYGWPAVTALADTAAEAAYVATSAGYQDPMLASGDSETRVFAGLSVNPGGAYGGPRYGHLFYGDTANLLLVDVELAESRRSVQSETTFGAVYRGYEHEITDVAFAPAGLLYIATEGDLIRVERH